MEYLPTIGLEIHIELNTKTKMFCRCINSPFVKDPNIYTCPVCLGLPGALPFPNKKAVISTVTLGKVLNCQIAELSKWDRKSYFYPDLPKGYQISQYDLPIARNGSLKLKTQNSKLKSIRIRRIHLEEDTGKLLHVGGHSLIDYNRSGVPLVELVTEPDIKTAAEAKLFGQELQKIVRHLRISEANMEKGEMRVEANVSIGLQSTVYSLQKKNLSTVDRRPSTKLGTKVEIKNLNSFRSVERAIEYEIKRQREILDGGGELTQETRGWHEQKGETYSQRVKESESDYRYFPEPDIPPTQPQSLQGVGEIGITETYDQKRNRLIDTYNLDQSMVDTILKDIKRSSILDAVVSKGLDKDTINKIAVLLVNRPQILDRQLEEIIAISQLSTHRQKAMLNKAKDLESFDGETNDLAELESMINLVISDNPKAVEDYRSGRHQVIGFLVGQVVKQTKNNFDPKQIKDRVEQKLS